MKAVGCWLLALAAVGCSGKPQGEGLRILGVQLPDSTQCAFSADNGAYLVRGRYDPWGAVLGNSPIDGHTIGVVLQNTLQPIAATTPVVDQLGGEVRTEKNDISLLGFDTCWMVDDTSYDSRAKGNPIDCDSLPPAQRDFVPATGTVRAAEDSPDNLEVGVGVFLPRSGLAALFSDNGTTFNLEQIPMQGYLYSKIATNSFVFNKISWKPSSPVTAEAATEYFLTNTAAGPALTGTNATVTTRTARSVNWGSYPETNDAVPLLLQFRAVGVTKGGTAVRSEWYVHPVDLCIGCVDGACGGWGLIATCTDAAGVPYFEIFGLLPFEAGSAGCLPYDGLSSPTCSTLATTCPGGVPIE